MSSASTSSSASAAVPALAALMPGTWRYNASAVGLRSRLCEQMKSARKACVGDSSIETEPEGASESEEVGFMS